MVFSVAGNNHPPGDGGTTGHHLKKRPWRGSPRTLQQTGRKLITAILVISAITIGNAAFQTGNLLGASMGLETLFTSQTGRLCQSASGWPQRRHSLHPAPRRQL
jgi:hypothetical protein